MIKEAVAGAIDIVQIALRGLGGDLGDSGPHGEDDPSYKRYFDPGYLKVVGGVYQSILAALGAPNTQAIRDCISAVKMQFIYGDYIGSPTNSCAKGTVMAYYGFYGDKNGVTRSVICFCKLFFDTFRTHKPLAQLPNVPSPKKSNLKAYVDDISSRERFPEVDSGASTVLHECLHWWDITRGVLGDQSITDVEVQRPGTQVITKAYRPFYATKCKDATWRPQYGPVSGLRVCRAFFDNSSCSMLTTMCILRLRYTIVGILNWDNGRIVLIRSERLLHHTFHQLE